METNLPKIKEIAEILLSTEIQKTEFSPLIVQHPFTNTGIVCTSGGKTFEMLNILEDKEALQKWQNYMKDQIRSSKDAQHIVNLMNKPYVLTFLKYGMHYLSDKDFGTLFSTAWIASENPNCDVNFESGKLEQMFMRADPNYLMEPDELKSYEALDQTVTVYRGVTPFNAENIQALSWTLDYKTAEWFANRFGDDGTVYEATIDKNNILALFERRGEAEVIVRPSALENIQESSGPAQEIQMM